MNTEKLFSIYGQDMSLSDTLLNTSTSFKAFIQPLRYKNKIYLRGKFTEIGKNREDYYLYIGPPDIDISAVDGESKTLCDGSTSYLIYRIEEHKIKNERVYYWAIIRPVAVAQEIIEESEQL